ncbi:hypothetical protein ALQ47_02347 [Pseudomonas cichorii]|nr:hypothetical protein ALQ47_02347 [Pseudomonas cichorii]
MAQYHAGMRTRQMPGTVQQIVMTDARRMNLDQHFTRTDLRRRHFFDLQLLRPAEGFQDYRFHFL